ncbi:uncharacterized protein LOC123526431 [Mercenaria mercenaria]|uniref:uncharacterized protein LOC123526431 n=1 Tax=Mercenaria mercenaria TaxID=6596 RepID=UPI00234ED621|nr:uncharacterized protein LOC123526431 [Mercenaria mercenaria]
METTVTAVNFTRAIKQKGILSIIGILLFALNGACDGYDMENYCGEKFSFILNDEYQIKLELDDMYIYDNADDYTYQRRGYCETKFEAWYSNYSNLMFYFEDLDLDCDKGHLEFYTDDSGYIRVPGLERDICGYDKPQGVFIVDKRYFRIKYVPKSSQYISDIFSIIITIYGDVKLPHMSTALADPMHPFLQTPSQPTSIPLPKFVIKKSKLEKLSLEDDITCEKKLKSLNITETISFSGYCPVYAHECANSRCIDEDLTCNGYDSCGDGSGCDLSTGTIVGIVIGSLTGFALIVSVVVCCICCTRRSGKTPGVVQNTTNPAVIYSAPNQQTYSQPMYGVNQESPYPLATAPSLQPTAPNLPDYSHPMNDVSQGTHYPTNQAYYPSVSQTSETNQQPPGEKQYSVPPPQYSEIFANSEQGINQPMYKQLVR